MSDFPMLCTAGCGFFGNSAFQGMCSKCFRESQKKNETEKTGPIAPAPAPATQVPAKAAAAPVNKAASIVNKAASPVNKASSPANKASDSGFGQFAESLAAALAESSVSDDASKPKVEEGKKKEEEPKAEEKKKTRCQVCRKKVGLTGIACRCGGLFCGLHRYSDTHDCTFDYKGAAKEKLTKENPVVAFKKIEDI